MNPSLSIIAGPEARRRIQEKGFSLDLFDTFIGASGGPKWLTLYGLDRILCEALNARSSPIQMIGSSIGAVRIACYAQSRPSEAFDRFVAAYMDVPKKVNRESLRAFVKSGVRAVIEGKAIQQVLSNPMQPVHFIAVRCNGWASSERTPQLAMLPAAIMNVFDPSWIPRAGIERSIFASDLGSPILAHDSYTGDRIQLTDDNFEAALHATGAIPGFLEGVTDIPGAPSGVYRDGGIIDYHFKPDWHTTDGLILYPHFAPRMIPGWFDRIFPGRHLNPADLDRLVVLTPTPAYIAALPGSKIPDRNDARRYEGAELRRHWKTVVDESGRLGEDLHRLLEGKETPFSKC